MISSYFILIMSVILHISYTDLSRKPRSYSNSQQEIILIGGIFQSDARESPDHIAFNEQTNNLKFSKSDKYKIKVKLVYVDDVSDSFQISGAICQLLVSGVVAIFGPIHPRTVHTIQSLTDSHDLIYFSNSDAHHYASESIHNRRGNNIIKLRPLVSQAIVDFIQSEKWARILYLYDSNEALFRLRMIFEHTNSRRVDLSADARQYSASSSNGVLEYINKKSKRFSQKHIILDLKEDKSKQKIIEQMDDLKMDRVDYHYLITEIDEKEIISPFILNGGMNFTMLCPLDYNNPILKEFLKNSWDTTDMRRKYPQLFPKNTLKQKLMISYNAALIIDGIDVFVKALQIATPSVNQHRKNIDDVVCTPEINPSFTAKELKPAIRRLSFTGLTGKIEFDDSGFRNNYKIDVFEARVKQSLKIVGNWTNKTGLNVVTQNPKDAKIIKLDKNRPIRVTSIIAAPFLMRKKNSDVLEGFCLGLIEELAKILKFNFTLNIVKDEQFGAFVNGSWNGMIGELTRNEADIAVAPLTITSSRERVVDFSTPFMEFGLSVMYLKSKPPIAEPFDFMKPLSKDIWMCITFAYLGVSVVLFLVSRFNPYEWGIDSMSSFHHHSQLNPDAIPKPPASSNDFTIFNSFWFSLSAFMQQGGDIAPRSLAGRIVGGVWWFFTLIIVSSYTANLAAYLTVERMNNPIKSYEDLANQNKIRYGVVNSGSSKEFFSKSKIEVFQKMWQFMESNPDVFVPSIHDGVRRVINSSGEYAFLLESTMNDYYNQKLPCETAKIGHNLDSGKGYGIATPPGSSLRDSINLAVLELKEKNKIPELREYWWKTKSECLHTQKDEANDMSQNSVKLNDIRGLFYVLSCGLCIGLIFSVLELFYKCALESRRKNKRFWKTLKTMLDHSVEQTIPITSNEFTEPLRDTEQINNDNTNNQPTNGSTQPKVQYSI